MSKLWEFAVTPRQATIIAACLTFAGLLLSGAGVVAGLLLAPRFPGFETRMTASPKVPVAGLPHVAAKPLAKPALPKLPDVVQASGAMPGTGAEASVIPPVTAPVAPPAASSIVVQTPAPAGAPSGLVAATSTSAPAAGIALKRPSLPIQMTVRVGSFSIEENARNFVERLNRFGYHALDIPGIDSQGHHWNVVQVGPYADYDDASKAVMELSVKYRLEPVIVPVTAY